MEYKFRDIEQKWRQYWIDHKTYKTTEDAGRKKFYVLNMFPYPSGAGLHVGHPLGYIASDIYARYKRLQGYNVLNPMVCRPNNMPYKPDNIRPSQQLPISNVTGNNWIKSVFRLIGIEK